MNNVVAAEGLNPLVPHLSEIIVGTIAFALLFWLLARTVFPQFEKVYAERTDKIEGGLKRAEEAQEQAAALKRQYEEQLAGLRAEAARIRDDARAEGNRIRAELREQAERAERIRRRVRSSWAAARADERQASGRSGACRADGRAANGTSWRRGPPPRTVDAFIERVRRPRRTEGGRPPSHPGGS